MASNTSLSAAPAWKGRNFGFPARKSTSSTDGSATCCALTGGAGGKTRPLIEQFGMRAKVTRGAGFLACQRGAGFLACQQPCGFCHNACEFYLDAQFGIKLYTRFRHLSKDVFHLGTKNKQARCNTGPASSMPSCYGCGGGPEPGGIVSPSGMLRRYSQETKRTSSHTCPSASKVSMFTIHRFTSFSSR